MMSDVTQAPITNVTQAAIRAVQETSSELAESERRALEVSLAAVEARHAQLLAEIHTQGAEISKLRTKLAEIKQRRTGDIGARSGAATPAGGVPVLPAH